MNSHEQSVDVPEEFLAAKEYVTVNEGESLDDYFLRMGEHIPHVKIELYSTAHATNEDASGVRKRLPQADIYIPESVGWKDEDVEHRNLLSQNMISDLEVEHARKNGGPKNFSVASLAALEGSGAAVVAVDFPKSEYKIRKESQQPQSIIPERNYDLSFDEAVVGFDQSTKRFAAFQLEREAYMRAHLGPKILEAIQLKPELREKSGITVLMPLGSSHTDIYHKLRSVGTDIERTFQSAPYIYPHSTELQRRRFFSSPIQKELEERAFIEQSVFEATGRLSALHESSVDQLIKRVLVEILDSSERREFYASYQGAYTAFYEACKEKNNEMKQKFGNESEAAYKKWAYGRNSDFKREIAEVYADILKRKNILLPTTDEEKIEFLRAHAPDVVDYIERNDADQIVSE